MSEPHELFAEGLLKIGWSCPNDAQWSRIKDFYAGQVGEVRKENTELLRDHRDMVNRVNGLLVRLCDVDSANEALEIERDRHMTERNHVTVDFNRLTKENEALKAEVERFKSQYSLEEIKRLREALKVVMDNSINPDHTMTLLGLTEVVDTNFKIATSALNHKEG